MLDSASPPRPPLAMIFDMDGVLIHSMPLHMEAWRQYLAGFGKVPGDLETRMHGKRNSELVRDLIGAELADDAVFEHGAAKERLFRELMLKADLETYRITGLAEFLERHRTMPMAVGSNAERANIDLILKTLGLRQFFRVAVDGSQVPRPKPYPDIYLKASQLLDVPPANCIVFEDSPTGVTAGLAAGMRVVGVETTPTAFEGVELVVDNFSDSRLESWLEEQRAF